MLPRATLVDGPLGTLRRWTRRLAWWRSRDVTPFVIGHCATAGALQLGALLVELSRAGRPIPPLATLYWAWLGLALIAAIPATVTILTAMSSRRGRRLGAFAIGLAFYALPVIVLAGAYRPIAILVPVAVLWHTVLARAPVSADALSRRR